MVSHLVFGVKGTAIHLRPSGYAERCNKLDFFYFYCNALFVVMKAHIFSFQLGKMANRVGYNPDDKVTF